MSGDSKRKEWQGDVLRAGPQDDRSWEEIADAIARQHPIELDERQPGLEKPLIIENAFPGWQSRFWPDKSSYPAKLPVHYTKKGDIRFEAVPTTVDEQVEQIVEGVKAGCALSHVHPRDPKDSMATHDLDLYTEIYDRVFDQVDVVSCQHTWSIADDGSIDYITDGAELIRRGGGNKYLQSAVVLWPTADAYPKGYVRSVQEGMEFFKENKIVPVHKIRGSYHLRKMQRTLLDTGILTDTPHVLVHDMGHPFGWTMDISPWWPIDMITSLETSRKRIPDCILGVYSGGRNWMPITFLAILTGVDLIRVGIEDSYWMYPHRDDVIQKNIDAVNKVVELANLLGRPLATPEQAREILGVERTS